ncbi:hypothetical protein MSG28_012608 [Choristoneura fumiferana]|uniref:Uncharacterized protein n=1 Tax=Choristoneura fumiferana TaxID=7141 RepID=A0ACC0JHB5_CHOFU|nr:hypothetical protein MSG28_012608 [Choristoneura fumiferana]
MDSDIKKDANSEASTNKLTIEIEPIAKPELVTVKIEPLQFDEEFNESNNVYTCNICTKQFKYKSSWRRHTLIHTGKNLYTCNVCNKQMCDKIALIKHLRVHTGEKPYACDLCKQGEVHTHEKKYTCEMCNKQYTKSSTLARHKITHSAEKPYTCEICERQFTQKSNLMRHVQNHTNRRPYGCTMCEKKFTQISSLKHHELTHTRKNNFVCGVCNKDFPYASHLERHERSHTKEKPYQCDICQKHFTDAFNVRRHLRLHMEAEINFKIIHRLHSICVQIVLQWIPSHVGLAGNEQADSLANIAVSRGVEIGCKPYGTELMYLAKAKCNEQWQIVFNKVSEAKGIWYSTIQNKVYKVVIRLKTSFIFFWNVIRIRIPETGIWMVWKCKCDYESSTFRRSNADLQVHQTGLCIQRLGFGTRECNIPRIGKRSVGRPTRRTDDLVKAVGSRWMQAKATMSNNGRPTFDIR